MLVAKAKPSGWGKETLLLRFMEETGTNTAFQVAGEALKDFANCELWRVYDMEVAGSCVKSFDTESKYGVRNTQEVRLQYPCKLRLSRTAWTPKVP